jgi:hypothetical protein
MRFAFTFSSKSLLQLCKIENSASNYSERGKHVNESHDNYNDHLYKPNVVKLHS